jgi:hypothetical protein
MIYEMQIATFNGSAGVPGTFQSAIARLSANQVTGLQCSGDYAGDRKRADIFYRLRTLRPIRGGQPNHAVPWVSV